MPRFPPKGRAKTKGVFFMRKDFDQSSCKAVSITMGNIRDEEAFFGLLGTVVATAIVGKIPSREDRASFVGTSESKLARLVKSAVDDAYYNGELKKWFGNYAVGCPTANAAIYALAAQIVSRGFYCGDGNEPISRRVAREFLNKYFSPQAIQNAADFLGYQMVLEYLWYVVDHQIIDFKKFVGFRYDDVAASKCQSFCDIIASTAIESGDYDDGVLLIEKGKYNSIIRGLLYKMVADGEIKGTPEI